MSYCEKCGNKLGDNDKFCGKCGAVLRYIPKPAPEEAPKAEQYMAPEEAPKAEPYTAPEEAPKAEPYTAPEEAPKAEQYTAPERVPQPRLAVPDRSGNKSRIAIIILAVVLVLVLAGGGIFLAQYYSDDSFLDSLFHKDSVKDDDDTDDEEDEEDAEEEDEEEVPPADDKKTDSGKDEAGEKEEAEAFAEPEPTPEPTAEPEPTPTPIVWEDWDLDFDAEQAATEEWARASVNNREHYKKKDYDSAIFYIQDGVPVIIAARSGVNGWKYNRTYIGADIYYVELDDGYSTIQTFYFSGGNLYRVVDMDGTVHDYGSEGWEEFKDIGDHLKEDRKSLLEDYNWKQK